MSAVLTPLKAASPAAEFERRARIRRILAAKRDGKAEVFAELEAMVRRGIEGELHFVPFIRTKEARRPHEILLAVADALKDALRSQSCAGLLRLALKDSACPHIADLRNIIRVQYATEQAELLIDHRRAPLSEIRLDLEAHMRRALSGLQDRVPAWTLGSEIQGDATDYIVRVLDAAVCFLPLGLALRRSTCPLVIDLVTALCKQYAEDNYEAVAEVRGYV